VGQPGVAAQDAYRRVRTRNALLPAIIYPRGHWPGLARLEVYTGCLPTIVLHRKPEFEE